MNLALNTIASRATLWRRGPVGYLSALEECTFSALTPARIFPRIGRLRLGAALAAQHTPTTCGTTVLALANALFDDDLLTHLRARGPHTDVQQRAEEARQRFTAVQDRLLREVTGNTWPRALGTPPWGLARALRVPGTGYEHLPVDDRNAALTEVLTGVLQRAVAAGIPVPLYVGGSMAGGAATAVPRHVVLLVPPAAMTTAPGNDHARIYEPASGRVFRRPWSALWHRSGPDLALGRWTHVSWAVLPLGR